MVEIAGPEVEGAGRGMAVGELRSRLAEADLLAVHMVRSPVGRLAAAVEAIESGLLLRDVAARKGEPPAALLEFELVAATTACVALDEAVDHLDQEMARLASRLDGRELPGGVLQSVYKAAISAATSDVMPVAPVSPGQSGVPEDDRSFKEVESHLLQLAGVSQRLADAHVRSAVAAFAAEDWNHSLGHLSYHGAVMRRYELGRDAVCRYADELTSKRAEQAQARRSRNRVRLLGRILGGTLIGGVNAGAALILGDFAGAVSAVIGSAAAAVSDEILKEV